ncbi:malonate decarboxylase holo-ACP synthase [Ralstonia soli]|uniref:Malonate decarboxylase holo-ACP synthase n=1 Tax=Ralstonia soli TaxID=2953896 RepID=A0ABT1AQK9_9RALS|nr:malonate decarboxylase holo-ACP synthase [Ralstonia soli]MCO5400561.1 malonate decarboxylase holo-ACP synthase [Ralstonia soli]
MTQPMLRAHDLLWVSEMPTAASGTPLPDWAVAACKHGAPVVVRRAPRGADGSIPVGLRGSARSERCAATVAVNTITRIVTPETLATTIITMADDAPFAALRTLRALAPELDALGWAWGPTGGAGFALASGLPVLHTDSDLDLVVRMPHAPSTAQRDHLVQLLNDTECRVDLQIDTGHGGFALQDWRNSWLATPCQTLLKTDHGPRLVADPWSDAA